MPDASVWCSDNKPLRPIIYILSTGFKRNVICLHEDHTLWKLHLCVVTEGCNGSKSPAENKRWSLIDSNVHKVVSELKGIYDTAVINMLGKITRNRREMETRVCFRLETKTPVPFRLYFLLYRYFILPAIKPDNPNLYFVLAYNGHHTTGHKAHPLNLSTTTYIKCASYHTILAVPESQKSLFSQAPRERMAHTEHIEYTNLQRKIVLRSGTHSRNKAKFSSTWKS